MVAKSDVITGGAFRSQWRADNEFSLNLWKAENIEGYNRWGLKKSKRQTLHNEFALFKNDITGSELTVKILDT
jgi:hypothetical protein